MRYINLRLTYLLTDSSLSHLVALSLFSTMNSSLNEENCFRESAL